MKKTKRNNFDKSSTGTNIECFCQYDSRRSQAEFDENIEVIQHSGYSTTSIGYYIDNGNVPGAGEIKFAIKGKKENIIKAAKQYTGAYCDTSLDVDNCVDSDIEDMKQEIISSFEDINLINYAMDKLPEIEGLEIVPNKNLIVLTTKGYCHGDYAKVIYCPGDLEKCWGNMPVQKSIQEMIDHYYYDSPIYARLEINGTEYAYEDTPFYDDYEWKRKEFIDYVSKESGVAEEILKNFVPEHPEYN